MRGTERRAAQQSKSRAEQRLAATLTGRRTGWKTWAWRHRCPPRPVRPASYRSSRCRRRTWGAVAHGRRAWAGHWHGQGGGRVGQGGAGAGAVASACRAEHRNASPAGIPDIKQAPAAHACAPIQREVRNWLWRFLLGQHRVLLAPDAVAAAVAINLHHVNQCDCTVLLSLAIDASWADRRHVVALGRRSASLQRLVNVGPPLAWHSQLEGFQPSSSCAAKKKRATSLANLSST